MYSILRIALASIIIMLLAACSTVQVGQDFDVRSMEMKIERGVTTQNQVRGWLGAPTGVGVNMDSSGQRFEEWTYYYGTGTLPDLSNAKVKILQVNFDKQGIVRSYNWSTSEK